MWLTPSSTARRSTAMASSWSRGGPNTPLPGSCIAPNSIRRTDRVPRGKESMPRRYPRHLTPTRGIADAPPRSLGAARALLSRGSADRGSGADGVPDGLGLQERREPIEAGVEGPVGLGGGSAQDALEVLGGLD